jgi:hypothetical protein
MSNIRQNLIIKINNLKQDDLLVLTEEEVKYCIERWIKGNYDNIPIENIKLYHYTQPNDPNEKEMIGAKILLISSQYGSQKTS